MLACWPILSCGLLYTLSLTLFANAASLPGPLVKAKLTVLTVHNDTNSINLARLVESSKHPLHANVYDVQILNTSGDFNYYHSKFYPLIPALRLLGDDELILVVDGNDILFLPCGRDLQSVFRLFMADIVLAHAKFQHPDRLLEFAFPRSVEYDTSTRFPSARAQEFFEARRFIDSGVILAKAGSFKTIISNAYLRTLQLKFAYPFDRYQHWDDQQFWTQLYLAQTLDTANRGSFGYPRISIDHEGLISQHFTSWNTYILNSSTRHVYEVAHNGGERMYKHAPCILQAPGGATNYRPMMETFYTRWQQGRHVPYKAAKG